MKEKIKGNSKYTYFLKENTLGVILMIASFVVANILNTVILKSYNEAKISTETIPFSIFLILSVFAILILSIASIFVISHKNQKSIIKAILLFALISLVLIAGMSFASGLFSRWLDTESRTLNTTKGIIDNVTLIIGVPIKAYLYCLFSVVVMEGLFKLNISGTFYFRVFILTLIMTVIDMLLIAINSESVVLNIAQAVINTVFLSIIFVYTFSYDKMRFRISKKNSDDE